MSEVEKAQAELYELAARVASVTSEVDTIERQVLDTVPRSDSQRTPQPPKNVFLTKSILAINDIFEVRLIDPKHEVKPAPPDVPPQLLQRLQRKRNLHHKLHPERIHTRAAKICADVRGMRAPLARECSTLCNDPEGDSVLLFGGTDGKHLMNDVWVFNKCTEKWSEVPCIGEVMARSGHTAVVHNGSMLVYGGYGSVTTSTESVNGLLSSICEFDLLTHTWNVIEHRVAEGVTALPEDCFAIQHHTAIVYDHSMYVFGGCTVEGRTARVRCFDLKSRCWREDTRYNKQIASEDDKEDTSAHFLTNVPYPRSSHSACLMPVVFPYSSTAVQRACPCMVVFGGRVAKNYYSNSTFLYSLEHFEWRLQQCTGTLPSQRASHSACVHGKSMIVYGGYRQANNSGRVVLDDMFVLNTATLVWRQISFDPHPAARDSPYWPRTHGWYMYPRSHHSCVLYTYGEHCSIHMMTFGGWLQLQSAQPSEDESQEDVLFNSCGLSGHTVVFTVAAPAALQKPEITYQPKAPSPTKPIPKVDVEKSVHRLTHLEMDRRERLRERLNSKYNSEQERFVLTGDEQQDSVDRLYYASIERKKAVMDDLKEKWKKVVDQDMPEPIILDGGAEADLIERVTLPTLSLVHAQEPLTPHKLAFKKSAVANPEKIKSIIERLHKTDIQRHAAHLKVLDDKYYGNVVSARTKPATEVIETVSRLSMPREERAPRRVPKTSR